MDDLILDVASPHTRQLLQDYKRQHQASRALRQQPPASSQSMPPQQQQQARGAEPTPRPRPRLPCLPQDRSQLLYLQRFRATASTVLRVDAGSLTLRVAFSHVPFWKVCARTGSTARGAVAARPARAWAAQAAGRHTCWAACRAQKKRLLLLPQVASEAVNRMVLQQGGATSRHSSPQRPEGGRGGAAAAPFRPSSLQIMAGMQVGAVSRARRLLSAPARPAC